MGTHERGASPRHAQNREQGEAPVKLRVTNRNRETKGRGMKNIIVFDVDGVLLDCTHRLHYVTGVKDWEKFFSPEEMGKDTEASYYRMFSDLHNSGSIASNDIRICTARPEQTRETTRRMLRLSFSRRVMLMRADGDHRPDHVVKKEMLDKIGKESILFWIDDSPAVCDMLRANGVDVLQVGGRQS